MKIKRRLTLLPRLLLASCSVIAGGGCSSSGGGDSAVPPGDYVYQVPVDMGDGWTVGSVVDVNIVQSLIERATREIQRGTYTGIDGMVIVRNGLLVHDVYFNGFTATRRHDLRSATKSITSMLVGIAIDQEFIGDATEPALPYIPGYPAILNWDDRKNSIEIRHFLTMTPGLACNDSDPVSPGNEERMYRTADWVKFILDLPMVSDPGQVWNYCTGGVVSLGAVIDEATGTAVDDFAAAQLFGPLGIDNYNWEYTPRGRVDTGGHIHMTPRDMGKIGELMLRRGLWANTQIVSDAWVDNSTGPHVALNPNTDYGYLWWRRAFGALDEYQSFYADGNGGQNIFVVPTADLVVVFTGSNYNSPLSEQPFEIMERYILPAL